MLAASLIVALIVAAATDGSSSSDFKESLAQFDESTSAPTTSAPEKIDIFFKAVDPIFYANLSERYDSYRQVFI